MKRITLLAAVGVLLALGSHAAEPAGDDAAERQRIAGERVAIEAAHAQRLHDCQARFAVTPCIEQARAARRESLASLRRQQALLDEAQRKQRAAERLAAIRAKVSAEESREREPRRVERQREAPMRVAAPRAGKPAAAPASAPASAAREAAEARKRTGYEARQREAQVHREEAQRRAAERANSGKPPAAPLPAASGG